MTWLCPCAVTLLLHSLAFFWSRRLHKVLLPHGWIWATEWAVDKTRGDEEGWEYAVNFDWSWHNVYGTAVSLSCPQHPRVPHPHPPILELGTFTSDVCFSLPWPPPRAHHPAPAAPPLPSFPRSSPHPTTTTMTPLSAC